MEPNKEKDRYFSEAKSWYDDTLLFRERQITIYRLMTFLLAGLLSLSILGLTSFAIREKVQPYLAIVDKRTGEVTTPSHLNEKLVTENWAVIRHFVRCYVMDRESYNFLNINEPYKNVMRMSDKAIQVQVDHVLRPEFNKDSSIKILGRDKTMTVNIHSISKLENEHLLDVRFTTNIWQVSDNHLVSKKEWRAILKWKLTKNQSLQDWDSNPLGFTIIFYDKQPVI